MVIIEYQDDGKRVSISEEPKPQKREPSPLSPEENSRFTREFIDRINEKRKRLEGS